MRSPRPDPQKQDKQTRDNSGESQSKSGDRGRVAALKTSSSTVRFRSHLEGTIQELKETLEKLNLENEQLKKRVKELGNG